MTQHRFGRLFAAVSLAAILALVAACSGPSSSVSPTGPTAVTASSTASGGGSFSANGGEEPPSCDPQKEECEPPSDVKGRFTGGGFQIADVKVTRGFTIHCDNILTNNLEVNWGRGNNFHMDRNALSGVVCTRPVDPTPPAAGVSRISASSTGTCNGLPANISFILEDHGEPGRNDRAELIISGGCTLNLPLARLDGGNIQAHFDQPHRR